MHFWWTFLFICILEIHTYIHLHRLNKTLGGRKSLAQNRKVAFIVDNSTAHPDVPGLTGIHLIFVLPNTTPVTQSMNQGVIQLLKAKCIT